MVVSRVVLNEVAYAIRAWLTSVPSLGASAEERSIFQLRKAEVFDLLAGTQSNPCAAAQALQLAARARDEARAIAPDY